MTSTGAATSAAYVIPRRPAVPRGADGLHAAGAGSRVLPHRPRRARRDARRHRLDVPVAGTHHRTGDRPQRVTVRSGIGSAQLVADGGGVGVAQLVEDLQRVLPRLPGRVGGAARVVQVADVRDGLRFAVAVASLAEQGDRALVARDRLVVPAEMVPGVPDAVPGPRLAVPVV